MSEHNEQVTVIKWFRLTYPRYRGALFAIPNGAVLCDLPDSKRRARMGYLYDEGFRAGVSDLFLALPTQHYHGLWIEMKDQKKTISDVSPEQKLFLFEMQRYFYAAYWAAGCDHAMDIIKRYMLGFDNAKYHVGRLEESF